MIPFFVMAQTNSWFKLEVQFDYYAPARIIRSINTNR